MNRSVVITATKSERVSQDSSSTNATLSISRREIVVSLVAGACCILFSTIVVPLIKSPLNVNIDPDGIGALAANISAGKGFVYGTSANTVPAFDRGPMYPCIVAVIFKLSGGANILAVQLFQAVCHAFTCILTFLLALELFNRRIARIAQLMCAFHPLLIWYTARILIESVNTLLFTLALVGVLAFVRRPSYLSALAMGVLVGIASLTKSIALYIPVAAGLYHMLVRGKNIIPKLLFSLVVTLAVIFPWTIRNYVVSSEIVPVHTSLGLNMVQGDVVGEYWARMPFSTIDLWKVGKVRIDSILQPTGLSAVEPKGDRLLVEESLRHNLRNPGGFLQRITLNALTLCYLGESRAKSIFLGCIQFPFFICVAIASIKLLRTSSDARVLVAVGAGFFLVHAFIIGWARYSAPILPAGIVLAAWGIGRVKGWI